MNTRIQNKYDLEVNWNALEATLANEGKTFVPLQGEVIIYGTEVDETGTPLTLADGSSVLPEGRTKPYTYPRMKIGDGKTALGNLDFISSDSQSSLIKINNVPEVVSEHTYNGTTIRPSWNNYNSDELLMGGQTEAINAGTYTVTFSPRNGYCWEDGTVETKLVSWTIDKAVRSLQIATPDPITIENPETHIKLDYDGDIVRVVWVSSFITYSITSNNELILKTNKYYNRRSR